VSCVALLGSVQFGVYSANNANKEIKGMKLNHRVCSLIMWKSNRIIEGRKTQYFYTDSLWKHLELRHNLLCLLIILSGSECLTVSSKGYYNLILY
jgi:hypothetical protein